MKYEYRQNPGRSNLPNPSAWKMPNAAKHLEAKFPSQACMEHDL